MFGFVLPQADELTVAQFLRFRRCYCGLCRTLGREYGHAARLILNYDFTFLAMLLWQGRETGTPVCKGCPAHPLGKRASCPATPETAAAAGCSVILAWHKAEDDRRDEAFPDRMKALALQAALHRAYRRAAARYPDFDQTVRDKLAALRRLEEAGCDDLDAVADPFAAILSAAGELADTPEKRRVAGQLLYHVGRWIYVMDARQDLKDDLKNGRYNVLRTRCDGEGALPDDVAEGLARTADASRVMAGSALALWPENAWSDILENVVTRGMAAVGTLVFTDAWQPPRRRLGDKIGDTL